MILVAMHTHSCKFPKLQPATCHCEPSNNFNSQFKRSVQLPIIDLQCMPELMASNSSPKQCCAQSLISYLSCACSSWSHSWQTALAATSEVQNALKGTTSPTKLEQDLSDNLNLDAAIY